MEADEETLQAARAFVRHNARSEDPRIVRLVQKAKLKIKELEEE